MVRGLFSLTLFSLDLFHKNSSALDSANQTAPLDLHSTAEVALGVCSEICRSGIHFCRAKWFCLPDSANHRTTSSIAHAVQRIVRPIYLVVLKRWRQGVTMAAVDKETTVSLPPPVINSGIHCRAYTDNHKSELTDRGWCMGWGITVG